MRLEIGKAPENSKCLNGGAVVRSVHLATMEDGLQEEEQEGIAAALFASSGYGGVWYLTLLCRRDCAVAPLAWVNR